MNSKLCSECGVEIGGRHKRAVICGAGACTDSRRRKRVRERYAVANAPDPLTPKYMVVTPSNGFSHAEQLQRRRRAAEMLKADKPDKPREHIDDDGPTMLSPDCEPFWNGFPPGPRRRRLMKLFAEAGYGD